MNKPIKCEWCRTRYAPDDDWRNKDQAICKTCGRATNVLNFKHRCVGCGEWHPIHVGRVRDDLTMVCSAKCEQDTDSVSETGTPA